MPITLPNLGLKVWNAPTDPYNSEQLAQNWYRVDQHDHSPGKGRPLASSSLQDGAVTQFKLADGAVINRTIATGAVTGDKLATPAVNTTNLVDGSVQSAKLGQAPNGINTANINDGQVTSAKIAAGTIAADRLSEAAKADLLGWVPVANVIMMFPAAAAAGYYVPSVGGSRYQATATYVEVDGASTTAPVMFPLWPGDVLPASTTTNVAKVRVRSTVLGSLTSPNTTVTAQLVNCTYRLGASSSSSLPFTLGTNQPTGVTSLAVGPAHFAHYVGAATNVTANNGLWTLLFNITAAVAASTGFCIWNQVEVEVST